MHPPVVAIRATGSHPVTFLVDNFDAVPRNLLRNHLARDARLAVHRSDGSADGRREQSLSERELDVADWGFAYGVAWARARERGPAERADEVAREALRAAQAVFSSYAAGSDWKFPAERNGATGSPTGR